MKRILIVARSLEVGGAERALIGLLNSFDYTQYNIDLFLQVHSGPLFDLIPCEVNLLPLNNARFLGTPITLALKNLQFGIILGRLFAKIHAKIYNSVYGKKKENHIETTLSHRYTYRFIENINPRTEYDLAISFLTPHYICMHKASAKLKIAWIHTDYSSIVTSNKIEFKMWKDYDYIISISDNCTKSFLKRFPMLKDKIVRMDNIITKNMIMKELSNKNACKIKKSNNEILLCTVGRISTAKNIDNIPEICRLILDSGIKVKWIIIGEGGIRRIVEENIKKFGVEKNVILLGEKKNPYPYIKLCDFYIQPSRYEGKAVSVREAQILCKPVIITNYPTAKSQLIDGYDGVIVPLDNKGCAKGIEDFIKNKKLQQSIMFNIKKEDYSNSKEIEKLYQLIERKNND